MVARTGESIFFSKGGKGNLIKFVTREEGAQWEKEGEIAGKGRIGFEDAGIRYNKTGSHETTREQAKLC